MNRKLILIVVGLVVAGVVAAVLITRSRHANEPGEGGVSPKEAREGTGSIESDLGKTEECTINPGEPKLRADKYPSYTLKKGEHEFTESASLQDGTSLHIRSEGCNEFLTVSLSLKPSPKVARENSGLTDWLRWSDERVQTLETSEGGDWLKSEFRDFVQRASEAQAGGEIEATDSIQLCNDGAVPDEESGCTWEQGGDIEFKVDHGDQGPRVIIEFHMAS